MDTQRIPLSSIKSLHTCGTADCDRGHACSFCPREKSCDLDQPAHNAQLIKARLAAITQVIVVLGNKGGVGKSTVAAHLATRLAAQGHRVGLADADIHGPNAPRLFGLHETRCKVTSRGLTVPVYQDTRGGAAVAVGSLGFLLPEADTPVVWRDAYKHDYIHHLIGSFDWGPLDFLIVDMPPGTGNELITLSDLLEGSNVAAMLVSSAAAIALQDTLKAARFCRERGLPILGLVENFAGLVCPHCAGHVDLYPRDPAIEQFESAGITTLARLPYAPCIAQAAAAGDPGLLGAGEPAITEAFDTLADVCSQRLDRSSVSATAKRAS
jgi:ATP-binding protein involved in chromosome partitioning